MYSPTKYQKDLCDIICTICGHKFKGTRKRKICSNKCKHIAKIKKNITYQQIWKCKTCPKILSIKTKSGWKDKGWIKFKWCPECFKKHRNEYSRKRIIKKSPEEKLQNNISASMRMTLNNPMKNEKIVSKVRQTILNKIKDGELVYKTGKNHHLWKGNRDNNHIIRTRLSDWRKLILKRDNYRCVDCNSNKYLEVHHLIPLRDIIDFFTKIPLSKFESNSIEFEELIKNVIQYHLSNFEIAETLCKICHSKKDKYRKV